MLKEIVAGEMLSIINEIGGQRVSLDTASDTITGYVVDAKPPSKIILEMGDSRKKLDLSQFKYYEILN